MGIHKLWEYFAPHMTDENLSRFEGKRVGIDIYGWLYKCALECTNINTDCVEAYLQQRHEDTLEPRSPPRDLTIKDVVTLNETTLMECIVQRVKTLQQRFGIIPVCVFDGRGVPIKTNTHKERADKRAKTAASGLAKLKEMCCAIQAENTTHQHVGEESEKSGEEREKNGEEREKSGDAAPQQPLPSKRLPADKELRAKTIQLRGGAVRINPEIAHKVLCAIEQECQAECIVAPYEADPQLAYLCRTHYIDAVITDDSDLIAYFCPCIIRNKGKELNVETGRCRVLRLLDCAAAVFQNLVSGKKPKRKGVKTAKACRANAVALQQDLLRCVYNKPEVLSEVTFPEGFEVPARAAGDAPCLTYEAFLFGCILVGCDYTKGLPLEGIGKVFTSVMNSSSVEDVLSYGALRPEKREECRRQILNAFYCFTHHLVFAPEKDELVTYRPLPTFPGSDAKETENLFQAKVVGKMYDAATARAVCVEHTLNPNKLKPFR